MNKEIIMINDSVLIEDENGNKTQVKNIDNLEDVLIQGNIVEGLETRKRKLIKSTVKKNKILQKKIKSYKIEKIIITILVSFLTIFTKTFTASMGDLVLSNLGNLSLSSLSAIVVFSISSSIAIFGVLLNDKSNIKELERKLNANEEAIKFIEKDLEKQKQELNALIIKGKEIEERDNKNLEVIPVADDEQLQRMNDYIDLYYECGYNHDLIVSLYKKNKLRKKLQNSFNDFALDLIEEYAKEEVKKEENKKLVKTR